MIKKQKQITSEIILKDVLNQIEPIIELFSNDDLLLAIGSSLHGLAIEMGGTQNLPDIPDGMIDEDSLVDFAKYIGDTASALRLLKAILKKKVRIHYENRQFLFSKREIKNNIKGNDA